MNHILQTRYLDLEKRYQFEFYHMGGVIHHTGMLRLWSSYAQPTPKGKPEPTAWLGQQRKNVSLFQCHLAGVVLKVAYLCQSSDTSYIGSIKLSGGVLVFYFPALSFVHGNITIYPSDNADRCTITDDVFVRCMLY